MQFKKNIQGQKFNMLTAIEYVGKDNNNKSLWLFKCECGNEKVIRGTNVTRGNVKSCGCILRGKSNFKMSKKKLKDAKENQGNRLRARTELYSNNTSGKQGIHQRKSDGRYSVYLCYNRQKYQTTKKDLNQAIQWLEELKEGLGIKNENKKN